jgi:Phage tail assembly chaperone protein, TAC
MPTLTINGNQYEAKCNFKFDIVSDEKYGKENQSGFDIIYSNLLEKRMTGLLQFWNCALAYHKTKERPSVDAVATALEDKIEELGDGDTLFVEAFGAIDKSAFFKSQVNEFWKNVDLAEELANEDEKETATKRTKLLKDKRLELAGETKATKTAKTK